MSFRAAQVVRENKKDEKQTAAARQAAPERPYIPPIDGSPIRSALVAVGLPT